MQKSAPMEFSSAHTRDVLILEIMTTVACLLDRRTLGFTIIPQTKQHYKKIEYGVHRKKNTRATKKKKKETPEKNAGKREHQRKGL